MLFQKWTWIETIPSGVIGFNFMYKAPDWPYPNVVTIINPIGRTVCMSGYWSGWTKADINLKVYNQNKSKKKFYQILIKHTNLY